MMTATLPSPGAPPSGHFDYRWHGPVSVVTAAMKDLSAAVIGPLIVGDNAYVVVRSTSPLTLPTNMTVSDTQISVGLLGMFAGDTGAAPPVVALQPAYLVSAYEWLGRIPATVRAEIEVAAVQMANAGDGRLAAGLTALGTATVIDLRDPDGQIGVFLAVSKAATASASTPLTDDMITTAMTPAMV